MKVIEINSKQYNHSHDASVRYKDYFDHQTSWQMLGNTHIGQWEVSHFRNGKRNSDPFWSTTRLLHQSLGFL